jgi:hypothetical protein
MRSWLVFLLLLPIVIAHMHQKAVEPYHECAHDYILSRMEATTTSPQKYESFIHPNRFARMSAEKRATMTTYSAIRITFNTTYLYNDVGQRQCLSAGQVNLNLNLLVLKFQVISTRNAIKPVSNMFQFGIR